MALHAAEKAALRGFIRSLKKVRETDRYTEGALFAYLCAKADAYQSVLALAPHNLYERTLDLQCYKPVRLLP